MVDFYDKLKIKYEVFDFKEEISEVLINADLAISRCGASTSAELIEAQIPFIAIPYPFATDDHQFFNAKFYEEKGCCWILEQKNLNFDNLFDLIKLILKDRKILESKHNNMKKIDNKICP